MLKPKAPAYAAPRGVLPCRRLVLLGLVLVATVGAGRSAAAGPAIALTNLDGLPYADRLSFNRIQTKFASTEDHDVATLAIGNAGTAPLTVYQLTVAGPWQLLAPSPAPTPTSPALVAPGGRLDVTLQLTATGGDFYTGALTIASNDPSSPNTVVQLAGFWQAERENNQEPGLGHILRVLGYTTTIVAPGQRLNTQGQVQATGEEVLSPYWRKVDATQPVSVRQLAAFHGCCTPPQEAAILQWHRKGGQTPRPTIFRHAAMDSQSLLPRRGDPTTGEPLAEPAAGQFDPGADLFGFRVDGEWSDPTLNSPLQGTTTPCTSTTCHRVRFWPVRDRAGALVPNTYVMAGDYNNANPNYDYNDNVYLLSNLAPETPGPAPSAAQALYRLDAGGAREYLDSNGNWWQADTGLYSPSSAPAEGLPGPPPTDISLTRDDWLFSSYRGNVGAVPQAQRVLTYQLPVGGPGTYYVRLYFAERFWTEPGKRVFDVLAEGALLAADFDNVDIFARVNARDRAYVTTGRPVQVSDGALTLTLRAEVDYPAINAIEVYCPGTCPGSPTPSPTPGPSPSPTPPPTPLTKVGWLPMAQR